LERSLQYSSEEEEEVSVSFFVLDFDDLEYFFLEIGEELEDP